MTDLPAPEVSFVLASIRRDADAASAQRAAAEGVHDWAAVAAYALAHDVGWWAMSALPADRVPADVRERLRDVGRTIAMSALTGARQLVEVHRVIAAAGVRVVAYKGPALAADVHGDLGARFQTDLDLLVAERESARAIAVMRAIGYERPDRMSERAARVYSRWEGVATLERGDDWPVELHWRCQAPRYGGPQDPEAIVARAVPMPLAGGSVLVPAPEDLVILLALHGNKHRWKSLTWLADFAAAASRTGLDWQVIAERADAWRVRRALHYALLVAQALCGFAPPPALLARARRDRRAVSLARAIAARLTLAPDAPDIGEESTPRYDLQWLDGPWARARYLALAAALPTPQERKVARLPDALLPLAYPLRAWRVLHNALGGRR